jgi:plastocyanin
MGKWFGAAASAVVLAAVAAGSGVAGAADHKMGAMCSPSGTSLALTAENHAFDKDCLAVTAGEAFTIRFENRDADRHNVAILPSHTSTETLFSGDIVPGPKNTVYAVPNMKAGTYHFHCEVHPNLMQGTFIVAAAPTATTGAKPSATPSPTMSMGADTPAATPAPAPKPDATPAPKPDSSPPRAAASAPATPAAAPKTAAAAGNNLPHTGPASSRLLVLLAGLALAAGGLSVLGGACRAASKG